MQTPHFETWALEWAMQARKSSACGSVAGLLIDLAADPREVHLEPEVAFPLAPAAKALGVPSVTMLAALCQLSDARLLDLTELQADDGLWVTVRLLPPRVAVQVGQD